MKNKIKSILLVGLLTAGLTMNSTSNAFAATPPNPPAPPALSEVPAELTANATNVLFYFYGSLDAMTIVDSGTLDVSLRHAAINSRSVAYTVRSMSPVMFAYLLGRADQFDREADARGEE